MLTCRSGMSILTRVGALALNNLQGALGRTSGRSYKAAPRQLLQVEASNASTSPTTSHATAAHISKIDSTKQEGEGAAREAAKMGREALAIATEGLVRREPLTHRETLVKLEHLYDLVLDVEQRRRDQPPPEEIEEFEQWYVGHLMLAARIVLTTYRRTTECNAIIDQIFAELMVSAPLETRYGWRVCKTIVTSLRCTLPVLLILSSPSSLRSRARSSFRGSLASSSSSVCRCSSLSSSHASSSSTLWHKHHS